MCSMNRVANTRVSIGVGGLWLCKCANQLSKINFYLCVFCLLISNTAPPNTDPILLEGEKET